MLKPQTFSLTIKCLIRGYLWHIMLQLWAVALWPSMIGSFRRERKQGRSRKERCAWTEGKLIIIIHNWKYYYLDCTQWLWVFFGHWKFSQIKHTGSTRYWWWKGRSWRTWKHGTAWEKCLWIIIINKKKYNNLSLITTGSPWKRWWPWSSWWTRINGTAWKNSECRSKLMMIWLYLVRFREGQAHQVKMDSREELESLDHRYIMLQIL